MPLIWCSISSHGFGHAAQLLPVLNELGQRMPDLRVILRTTVISRFFESRLHVPYEIQPVAQDIGCIQGDPLTIDVASTWREHLRFHAHWDSRVREETAAIRAAAPKLVLSDISYLAIEAGVRAGVPAIGLCNLSWDLVLDTLRRPARSEEALVLRQMREAYQQAQLMMRPAPGLALTAFRKIVDLPPLARLLPAEPQRLRDLIAARPGERVVLVGFGGIDLTTLPFCCLEGMTGYRFVVSGRVPTGYTRICSTDSLSLPFESLLASADVLVTKPGYSTAVEAVALAKPVVYVRRHNFADEASLVEYLHRFGRAVELSAEEFSRGSWQAAFDRLETLPQPPPAPPATGAVEAAAILAKYVRRKA